MQKNKELMHKIEAPDMIGESFYHEILRPYNYCLTYHSLTRNKSIITISIGARDVIVNKNINCMLFSNIQIKLLLITMIKWNSTST